MSRFWIYITSKPLLRSFPSAFSDMVKSLKLRKLTTAADYRYLGKSKMLCHIECHMLNLSMDLINDRNIKEARMKIDVDLWEAAHDPILIERMENYKPPHQLSDILEID
ncbi:predicted protein [Arabidopsis lyrata subsp. lyrata]|uniref:Predicted protein n=1 Tax=Arabidopsis lyrata subsp. lyrata TaxID=81972 RepID=D7KV75_ARALL|nr:predicted protein [Arabidopsis lyrata subsp. lyrata]